MNLVRSLVPAPDLAKVFDCEFSKSISAAILDHVVPSDKESVREDLKASSDSLHKKS